MSSNSTEVPSEAPQDIPTYPIAGYKYVAFEWSMVAFTFILLLNRFYVRVYLYGNIFSVKSWRLSEFFILVSWMLYLAVAIDDTYANNVGYFNPLTFTIANLQEYISATKVGGQF